MPSINSRLVAMQLGNLYLLLCMVGLAVLSSTSEIKVVRNYLVALWIADISHIALTWHALGHDNFVDVTGWNAMTWGNVGATVRFRVNCKRPGLGRISADTLNRRPSSLQEPPIFSGCSGLTVRRFLQRRRVDDCEDICFTFARISCLLLLCSAETTPELRWLRPTYSVGVSRSVNHDIMSASVTRRNPNTQKTTITLPLLLPPLPLPAILFTSAALGIYPVAFEAHRRYKQSLNRPFLCRWSHASHPRSGPGCLFI